MPLSYGAEYTYVKHKKDKHLVHIITVPAQEYDIIFCKACNTVIGRETVASMAERHTADIAINAGFFEMGQNHDGVPSGTLIIDGVIFGLRCKLHACAIAHAGNLAIKTTEALVSARVNGQMIHIKKVKP